jgi:uncharacterized protein (TIGR02266 family)
MEIPAELSDAQDGARKSEAAIGNLGPDGAYVKTSKKVDQGARVRLAFKLSSHPLPLDVLATVMWMREGADGGLGLQFVDFPAYERSAIDDFCQHRLEETRGAAASE